MNNSQYLLQQLWKYMHEVIQIEEHLSDNFFLFRLNKLQNVYKNWACVAAVNRTFKKTN